MKVLGIHHISAISLHGQENIDFYAGVLGLRLSMKTVNFDQPNIYHLYYTNGNGDFGSAMTYFPWKEHYKKGQLGSGQVASATLSIRSGSLPFWKERLKAFKIDFNEIKRMNETYVQFKDQHGLTVELHEIKSALQSHFEFNGVPKEHSILGIHSALLYSDDYVATKHLLSEVLGLDVIDEDALFMKFEGESGQKIELSKMRLHESKMGAGSYHHLAFGVVEDLEQWRGYLESHGYHVTEVKDRHFFQSIYFKEHGGIIIELASMKPGFTLQDTLNPALFLAPQFESMRKNIEQELYPLVVETIDRLKDYPYQNLAEYQNWFQHQALLRKINDYAKLSKERPLTEDELKERAHFRKKYLQSIRGVIKDQLDLIEFVDEDETAFN